MIANCETGFRSGDSFIADLDRGTFFTLLEDDETVRGHSFNDP